MWRLIPSTQFSRKFLFLKYLEENIDKFTSTGKNLCLLGDFNFCLQEIETCNYSRDFLLALQNYLLATIDKPTRVHKNSASFIDLTSTGDNIKRKQIKKRDLSHFNTDSLNSVLATIDRSCIIKTHANNVDELF